MLKKIILSLSIIIILTSCSFKEETSSPKQEKVGDIEEKDYVEPYADENPISLGLYLNENGTKTLISSYNSPLTQYQDIISLEVYYTKDGSFTGNQKQLWHQYYQNYTNIDAYKIGYHIYFETNNDIIDKVILTPSDVESFFDYIQVYLYDDINQNSSWYSHITSEEVTDTTKLTSIKLTASTKIDEITSPITITAFTYDNDIDFDANGQYRGNSSYQLTITRK
ncbi:MAG: hypothetical protein IJ509_00600 [Bacilli bacterium]|nr:hypothetical protein [Bacilli bacterium]